MTKLMLQQNYPFGNNTYRYEDYQLEIFPYFLYEVSIYKIYNDGFNILSNKIYTSNKFLEINTVKILKNTRKYKIILIINLLGAPLSFIEENNLPIYKLISKKNEKRKN